MATAQACHALTTYYLAKYQERYKNKPLVNRNKARWGFDGILEDMSASNARELLDFYMGAESSNRHSLEWFFYNYDKLAEKKVAYEKDAADRRKLREETKRIVEERRKQKSGDTGSEDSGSSLPE